MGLASEVSLLVATLDLSLVRLLRDAIRTADVAGGKFAPPGASAVAQQSRQDFESSASIEPRRVFHPRDLYEPRAVLHPTPRIESEPIDRCSPAPCECTTSTGPGPLPPPWRIPVTSMPIPPRPIIKLITYRVDVHNKGSLIDVFL